MNKAEMLKKQAETNRMNLYLSNDNNSIDKEESIKSIEQNKESISTVKVNDSKKTSTMKMLSFRIPQEIIDNIDKYAYVQRMKKQDLIIMCFESFFNDNKAQEILKQYDDIKGGKEDDR